MEHILVFIDVITIIATLLAIVLGVSLVKAYGRMSLFEQTVLFNYPLLFKCLFVVLLSAVWWLSKLFL